MSDFATDTPIDTDGFDEEATTSLDVPADDVDDLDDLDDAAIADEPVPVAAEQWSGSQEEWQETVEAVGALLELEEQRRGEVAARYWTWALSDQNPERAGAQIEWDQAVEQHLATEAAQAEDTAAREQHEQEALGEQLMQSMLTEHALAPNDLAGVERLAAGLLQGMARRAGAFPGDIGGKAASEAFTLACELWQGRYGRGAGRFAEAHRFAGLDVPPVTRLKPGESVVAMMQREGAFSVPHRREEPVQTARDYRKGGKAADVFFGRTAMKPAAIVRARAEREAAAAEEKRLAAHNRRIGAEIINERNVVLEKKGRS